jgi:hypothetical protein
MSKKTRIYIAILIGALSLGLATVSFMGGLMIPDQVKPNLEQPGRYNLKRQIEKEKDYNKTLKLYDSISDIEERRLNFSDALILGLLGSFFFAISILSMPLAMALIFKLVKSPPLFEKAIHYESSYEVNQSDIAMAEDPGIYKFHKIDDEFIILSKPKMKKKLIRSVIIWSVITAVTSYAIYDPKSFEEMGIPTTAFLITLVLFLRYKLPAPKLILNRLSGEVKFEGNIVNPGFTADFEKIKPALMYGELLAFSHPIFEYSVLAYGEYGPNAWSFYVQYMDKNQPLPKGNVFDKYREKDYLRRKNESFTAPKYPSYHFICDANSGYINGTPDFKKEFAQFRLSISDAAIAVINHIEKESQDIVEQSKLRLLGIFKDQFVFKYMDEPVLSDLQLFLKKEEVADCYLIHKKTRKVIES